MATTACAAQVPENDHPCPCGDGWTCCGGVCVPRVADCAPLLAPDGGVGTDAAVSPAGHVDIDAAPSSRPSLPPTSPADAAAPAPPPKAAGTGSIVVDLSVAASTPVGGPSFVLENGASAVVQAGDVVADGGAFTITSVPAGSGYTLSVAAKASGSSGQCSGAAGPFSVASDQTVTEMVHLACAGPPPPSPSCANLASTEATVVGEGAGAAEAGAPSSIEAQADGVSMVVITARADAVDASALAYHWSVQASSGGGVALGTSTGNGTTTGTLALTCNPSVLSGGAVVRLDVTVGADVDPGACPSSSSIVDVACRGQGCPAGTALCGASASAACVNLAVDSSNCGACGTVCGSGAVCDGGCVCAPGTSLCGGTTCVPLYTAENCGGCGVACSSAAPICSFSGTGGGAACIPTGFDATGCDRFIHASEAGAATSSTCSQTELTLFQKDPTGRCLDCALKKACINDAIGTGDRSQECDDLATAATAPQGARVLGPAGVAECLAALACELGVSPLVSPSPLNVATSRALGNAYCGTSRESDCQDGSPSGACVAQITAGLASPLAGWETLRDIANFQQPSGLAGSIVSCLLDSAGGQCTSCVE
jgi:hypothetical protein